jgi:transcriptional regulator with GAF, ATPase, and Fis domain
MISNSSESLISRYGKESLPEILHHISTRLKKLYSCKTVRIYLEDLYEGMLVCQYVTDQNKPNEQHITKFVSPEASIISQAFLKNEVVLSWDEPEKFAKLKNPFEKLAGIKATAVFPITYQFRSIGTISLDWGKTGEFLDNKQKKEVVDFLNDASSTIDRAKRFHQKLSFSRHLDLARKKEAAWMMMRSAVELIDKLALASVWVPSSIQNPKAQELSSQIEILAAFSKNKEDALVYNNHNHINIHKENLINRIVRHDNQKGLVAKDSELRAVFIEDVMEESFSRKAVARKIDLVSLYQVPKFNPKTKQLVCVVNYYTNASHKFTSFEKPLLENHAAMVERLILEENPEHVEIEVLSEIEELLSDADDNLTSFLDKILAKTSELISADSGTISINKIIDGKPWLIIEDEENNIIGAKSRGWMKSKIPLMPVGGEELPTQQRSLNGYVAHIARPVLIGNVEDVKQTQGFYKNLSEQIKSELAVPIIYGSHVLGVINQDSFKKYFFTQEHQKILQIIASLISQKVNNLQQIETLKRELSRLKKDIEYRDPKVSSYHFGNIIGKSQNVSSLVGQIQIIVESIYNRMLNWEKQQQREVMTGLPSLLVHGQTGSGKEFFFNNIYSHLNDIFQQEKGTHFKLPLRKTNIAAYSGELTYSELFGHKKGAFTGAEFNRQGILEEANGGVVFLDEIGDADPKTQVQLLRFLDTGVFMRLGENQPRISKIFLIAATNKDLLKEIHEGRFREDLFHRLNALSFKIPRLNEREEDIADLATHFLGILFNSYKKEDADPTPPQLEPDALEYLKQHPYRGNVRELKNILLRAMLFHKGPVISKSDIMSACQPSFSDVLSQDKSDKNFIDTLLSQFESGKADFWTDIHRPFKANRLTRDTVRSLIITAKNRYQTNLPGLAVKLRACKTRSLLESHERKRFISFKNFLYKTVKISSN